MCTKKFDFFHKSNKSTLIFKIPDYRTDLNIEENIIAELIKVYGYNNIIKIPLKINSINNNKFDNYVIELKHLLINNGFSEIITYSFVDAISNKFFNFEKNEIFIKNPLSEKMNVMRTNLFCGLLNSLVFNLNRQNFDLRLFELGNIYFHDKFKLKYSNVLSAVITKKKIDHIETFFLLKKVLKNMFSFIYRINDIVLLESNYQFFDTNINASIIIDDEICGNIGLINKNILKHYSIKQDVLAFTMNLDIKKNVFVQKFSSISKYPSSIRDLSIIVKKNIIYHDIFIFIKSLNIPNLTKVMFIDCFYPKDENNQSVTFRFKFQSTAYTLLDKDINISMDIIQNKLKNQFLAEIKLN